MRYSLVSEYYAYILIFSIVIIKKKELIYKKIYIYILKRSYDKKANSSLEVSIPHDTCKTCGVCPHIACLVCIITKEEINQLLNKSLLELTDFGL